MPNIDVSADILEFMQAADYAAARSLLQDTAPYYGLIGTKTNVDATVASTAHYATFEAGLSTANTIPLFVLIRYRSGTFASPCTGALVLNGSILAASYSFEYLTATVSLKLAVPVNSYMHLTDTADGMGVYVDAANGSAAAFDFEVYGIILP